MKRRSGYTLIEVLTYIACLTVILTVAYPVPSFRARFQQSATQC